MQTVYPAFLRLPTHIPSPCTTRLLSGQDSFHVLQPLTLSLHRLSHPLSLLYQLTHHHLIGYTPNIVQLFQSC